MLATLVAALSLVASAPAMDVPFLPQTDALCGGAAAAMVLRYWGDAHADVQEFAPLVDRRAGGIVSGALVDAVRARGWRAERIESSLSALTTRVRDGQPVIVLVPERGNRYHYVVVTGASDDAIVVHDPSWGPWRSIRAPEFERAWRAAGFWSLVILPPATRTAAALAPAATGAADPSPVPASACDEKLGLAVAEIRRRGFEHADELLGQVRAECPTAAGPLRELSGVRFAERRWHDAAALARAALERDPQEVYALDVLGSSLFMQEDSVGALRAWNRIDKPRVNLVRIDGVRRTRHQAIAEVLGIHPNMLLKAAVFERARRRVSELPDQSTARLGVRPEADGFATVDVVVAERATIPSDAAQWVGAGVRAVIDREVGAAVPGVTGQGEVWSASWRWWTHRPRAAVGFAAPRLGRLPGVWRVEGSWQAETYAGDGTFAAALLRETRTRGVLSVSDWLSGSVRYALTAGLDSWTGDRKAASIGGSIERRLRSDRVSVSIEGSRWIAITGGRDFDSVGTRLLARSSQETRGWVYLGSIGAERVSDAAPFALWPGAGDGHARVRLLRAHSLLDDGIISLSGTSAFGRTLAYGSAEGQRWFERPSLLRVGAAGFVDVARASRRAVPGIEPAQVDVGAGLRVKVPGSAGILRVDVAHGLRDGATALTLGWLLGPQ
jgi:predicted double-glycine peptidase